MTMTGVEKRQPSAAGTIVIHGHELEPGHDEVAAMIARGWRGIQLCYCVWDSPESPCACIHDKRWWFPNGGILRSNRSDRKDDAGNALHEFEIAGGTPVLVEMSVELLLEEARKAAPAKA